MRDLIFRVIYSFILISQDDLEVIVKKYDEKMEKVSREEFQKHLDALYVDNKIDFSWKDGVKLYFVKRQRGAKNGNPSDKNQKENHPGASAY